MRILSPVSTPTLQLIFVLFHRYAHELAARAHARLLEQALEDGLDVAFRDLEPPGNLLVGQPFQDEAQHLALPLVEGRWGSLRRRRRIFAKGGERAVEPTAAGEHRADGGGQFAEFSLFEEDAVHALAQQAAGFIVADPGGDHQDAALVADLPGGG